MASFPVQAIRFPLRARIGRRTDASVAWPLFGPACAAALLAGVGGCLLLPALPPTWLLWTLLSAGAALACYGDARRLVGICLFGIAMTGLQAAHALDLQLPAALERTAQVVQGRIVELPVHEPRRTRFVFVVDDVASQPDALRGRRLRLKIAAINEY